MMDKLWVVFLVALTGAHLGFGSPVRSTPHSYPHNQDGPILEGWTEGSLYATVPALALVVTAVVLLIGCTWCYRHKDCKQNEGADNQLFTASATHLHERRSHPPDSGFSEPANNNISEDNNNGPISLREMQNIANNNAAAYIVSENEERNRVSRESVVEFEPLPTGIRVADPLERCVDWFGDEDFPRSRLQYLREIGRGWFGRVVEGEIEDEGTTTTVAVKILNQNASLEDKARFLDEARLYRDSRHENVLAFVASCLQEDPWILIFELCSMDLQSYLSSHRQQMEALDAAGVPLRLMCDVTGALVYLHSRGICYGELCTSNALVRGEGTDARAALGHYALEPRPALPAPPTIENDVHALGTLMWDICAWGAPAPDLSCRYRDHLYQVMQLCWIAEPNERPSAAQIEALLNHLHSTHARSQEASRDDGYGSSDFEDRWQRLKPNTIPKLDEHVAIVHAPSTSSHLTDFEHTPNSLSVELDSAVSRSSSIVSDKHLLRTKSASLNNLHGSLEDFRAGSESEILEDKEQDCSDASVDPWLKDIIADSQDDASYYRVVSDVIKNLDNILNSEKTSSSESSHQASPSRDNLSLDCKKDYPMQSSMVKSPGISNFQNILEAGLEDKSPEKRNEDEDRDTIGTLSHSFDRHGDTTSQATLENLTPDTPIKDMDLPIEETNNDIKDKLDRVEIEVVVDVELPKENKIDNSDSVLPNLTDLCIAPTSSVNELKSVVNVREDCQSPGDNKLNVMRDKESVEAKSISEVIKEPIKSECVEEVIAKSVCSLEQYSAPVIVQSREVLPEVTGNDETKNLLPSAALSDNNVADLRPEPISTCSSQNQTNNDLITPAKSTTDRKSTNVESVSHQTETLDSNVNHLDNASEISIKPTPSLIETGEEKTPLSTGTNEEILPATVQNESTHAVSSIAHDKGDEVVIQNNLEINSVPDSEPEALAPDCPEEELNFQTKEDDAEQGDFNKKLTTPALVLTDSRDEVISPTSIDKVSEAFVEKIIKEAETAALIETVHAKVMEPITDNKEKDKPVNDFLENEIRFLERSSVNEFALIPEVFSDKPVQSKASPDSLSMFLKEEIIESPKEAVNDSEVEDIAKKILNDAMQDVPKVIEKTEESHFFLKDDIVKDATGSPNSSLDIQITEKPESIQENLESTKSPIVQKENNIKMLGQVLKTMPVLPQSSLDLDSTASADSSQSTFLIRNTLKEESNSAFPEEHKQLPNELGHPQMNSESISNTLSEIDTNTMESTLDIQTPKSLQQEQSLHSVDTIITSNVAESITEVTVPNLESGMETMTSEQSNNSTAYMDLTNGVATGILELSPMEEEMQKVVNSCLETTDIESDDILVKNESTVYLDLPNVIRKTDEFLHFERQLNSNMDVRDPLSSSTPKNSTENSQNSEHDNIEPLSGTKVPDYGPGVTLTKLEQQCVPDFMSPFDSPSKSHPTDTYDENSSVVLGPFENCTIELFKAVKSTDLIDIPKEELFAFSSNFSEIDLETPSPLRDGNFLNEVPDIVNDDDLDGVEPKDLTEPKTDISDATDQSVTERRISPSTPPNSPGYFLASTSQQKYLVDIDLNQSTELPAEPDSGLSSLHKEIELNQIELQITSKLAMAENENNLNIEYSGPLTVEGVVQDEMQREEESGPEMLLAGNGDESMDDIRNRFALDEDCVTALRNELELKLPLAQVASIEPACETDKDDSWSESLPPPPELVVSYPGALSPIAEETAPQLSAYENDAPYIASARTESSESYPEPCNNSTDDASELPTAAHTYTLSRPPAEPSASETITMSADSLNESPKKDAIDDRTFTLEDEKDACERLSQVTPFVLSPTDASAPQSDVTGVSTLSHTTVPKTSKPSETHCLSKATSIDSWCSNDTLYNVEEAFDDLASDPELPTDECEPNIEQNLEHSDSTHTLTDKVPSHVSTYVVHDSQSDDDRFSPDSITAHDAHTYTKPRTDLDTSPSVLTKSEVNDSKTQTKDLAYGTLMSGVPSYSNCTTEVLSTDNGWLFPHPELVRRSPVETAEITAAILSEQEVETEQESEPQLKKEPRLKKMDSVEISCLEDHLNFSPKNQNVDTDSPNNYNMAGTTTSTPLAVIPADESAESVEVTPDQMRTPVDLPDTLPNFPSFFFSAALRPQNDSNAKYSPSLEDSTNPAVGSYTEFRNAAIFKPQDTRMQSSQSDSDSYRQFENSALNHPQETSISPSALLLMSERAVAEFTQPSQLRNEPTVSIIPPNNTNLRESHLDKVETVIITDLEEDETEQPHSIIIAEISKDNRTFESHNEGEMNHTYDSHPSRRKKEDAIKENNSDNSKELTVNGLDDQSNNTENIDAKSPETSKAAETQSTNNTNKPDAPKDSISNLVAVALDIKCNGNDEKFATVNFINESFEELLESNVDDSDCKDKTNDDAPETSNDDKILSLKETTETMGNPEVSHENGVNGVEDKVVAVTEDFLQNEKRFCELDAYLPLLSDIRFTGPASEIMTTSFTQESPTEPEGEKADVKDWDSDTDSHSTNSSSGEFIWKGGDGQETSVVPSTHFDHRGGGGAPVERSASASGSGSGSGSGSEGDEVEFVPSSWDCRAEPAKSSLRRLVDNSQDKKRVVFKRQKYHCVYEYPRELATVDADSPAYLPDLSTYADWEPASAEEAELGYGQLFGAPSPLDLYPLRGGFGADYDEDFFISSSARPFESLGALTTTSQFFPGRLKPASPPARAADLATPDSGVEDGTPADPDDYTLQKLPDLEPWRAPDSASSSESASPGSPEALGGLRHTRDKLKLDLPPSPHIPSPRHNRVFNFVLDKPKRPPTTPLVMTDETPLVTTPIPISTQDDPIPEPTFSTFGKTTQKTDPEQKMILTDEEQTEDKPPSPVKVEPVKGEGTVLDSGDEDSGIESSSKATLERNASVTKLEP